MSWLSNYPTLVALGILAIGLVSWELRNLKKFLHIDQLTATRKFRKASKSQKPIPQHAADQVPPDADAASRRFFEEFRDAADYLNRLCTDGPWTFHNTGQLNYLAIEESAQREMDFWYNQKRTGSIKLTYIADLADDTDSYRIDLNIYNPRFYDAGELRSLVQAVSRLVIDNKEQIAAADNVLNSQMIDALWQVGEDGEKNSPIFLRLEGKASKFRARKRKESHKLSDGIER